MWAYIEGFMTLMSQRSHIYGLVANDVTLLPVTSHRQLTVDWLLITL